MKEIFMKNNHRKSVYGVGINDADYRVVIDEYYTNDEGKKAKRNIFTCPYYTTWSGMLRGCYSKIYQEKRPTYLGCTVVQEWFYFTKFKAWMEKQDWMGNQLDKDILVMGNKEYGPETCCFISGKLNKFILDSGAARGEYPIGVYLTKKYKAEKYIAQCSNGGSDRYIGVFDTPEEAYEAWFYQKALRALEFAKEQVDGRVIKALVDRYSLDIKEIIR